jgi:hypothetical protein
MKLEINYEKIVRINLPVDARKGHKSLARIGLLNGYDISDGWVLLFFNKRAKIIFVLFEDKYGSYLLRRDFYNGYLGSLKKHFDSETDKITSLELYAILHGIEFKIIESSKKPKISKKYEETY